MKVSELEHAVGGLSSPSKMPWYGWSIPAKHCKTGGKLAQVPGTVCYNCYALKGFYAMPAVGKALQNRLDIYNRDNAAWVTNMSALLQLKSKKLAPAKAYFRWFDSGDLQSPQMLTDIIRVCEANPQLTFYLPTKELTLVTTNVTPIPANLVLRVSSPKVDQPPVRSWHLTSTVETANALCPAPKQSNKCGSCRACWDPTIPNISYKKH